MSDEVPVLINQPTRAATLLQVMEALSNTASPNVDLPIEQAWAKLLGVPRSSEQFYNTLAAISASFEALRGEISTSTLRPASKNLYLQSVLTLRSYAQAHNMLSFTTSKLKGQRTEFEHLTLLDDVLKPIENRAVPEGVLAGWKETVELLAKGVDGAFENETLREFVNKQIAYLRWAIDMFPIVGIDGLSKAYGAMVSELHRSQGMTGADKPKAREWFRKASKPVLTIGAAIAATSAVVQQADNLLTSGESVYEKVTDIVGPPKPEKKVKNVSDAAQ